MESFNNDCDYLEELYISKLYEETIDFSYEIFSKYDNKRFSKGLIIKIRAASFLKLNKFESSLSDFNKIGGFKSSDYFVLYHKALLNDILKTHDTAAICHNLTIAIESKGFEIEHYSRSLNYIDSSNIWDVNYIDMLALRVKYCSCKYPSKTDLDKELLKTLPNKI